MSNPFFPSGNTSNVAVTSSNQAVALNRTGTAQNALRVHVTGTEDVFINIGGTAAVATSMPVGAGHTEVFGLPDNVTSVGVIGVTGGLSTVYFTLGNGV
jgi:hypothetical protein